MISKINAADPKSINFKGKNYSENKNGEKTQTTKGYMKNFLKGSLLTIPVSTGAAYLYAKQEAKANKEIIQKTFKNNLTNFIPVALVASCLFALFAGKPDR